MFLQRRLQQSINYINAIIYPQAANFESIVQHRIRNTGIHYGTSTFEIRRIAQLSIICFLVTNVTQVIALFMAKDDPNKLFACFSVLSFCLMGFLKLSSLLGNQGRWRFLIAKAALMEGDQLKYNQNLMPDYESDDEEENPFSKHIQSYTKNFFNISTYLSRIYSFTAVVFMASPFIEYGIYVWQGKDVIESPHILPGWAPLEMYPFGYVLTILAESIAAVYCVMVHVAFDLTAVGLMIFIRGQFTLLHAYSGRIGGKGRKCNLSKKRDDRAHFRIIKCHQIHVSLLR